MSELTSSMGYDSNGNPCDFIDEDGTIWIYLGEKNGIDNWEGIPKED